MKALILSIALCIANQVCIAQLNFYYSSGRLLEEPKTLAEINSPYLAYYQNDELKWIAYDPKVKEGRFVSVSSTYSTVVACGYIKGPFNFLDNQIVTPSDSYTGIAASVSQNQNVEWFYVHNNGIVPSKFHWSQKLRDGMTLLSGHEYKGDNKTAILLRINKEGEPTWTKRIDGAIGLEVKSTRRDRIFWMIHNEEEQEIRILELDQFSGDVLNSIEIPGKTSDEGIRMSKTFFLSEEALIAARLPTEKSSEIVLERYQLDGNLIASVNLSYLLDYNSILELQGVAKRPNGQIQLALNLYGAISFNNEEPIRTKKGKEILVLTLHENGDFIGTENFGSDFAEIGGIHQINGKVAISGGYEGELTIQDQRLEYKKDETNTTAFLVYLDEYDPISNVDLSFDPDIEVSALTIYPNPVTTQRKISIVNEKVSPDVKYEIRIYDNTAKLQSTQTGRTRFETSRDELTIASLPSGIFHAFVIQDNAVISQGKFIITR